MSCKSCEYKNGHEKDSLGEKEKDRNIHAPIGPRCAGLRFLRYKNKMGRVS